MRLFRLGSADPALITRNEAFILRRTCRLLRYDRTSRRQQKSNRDRETRQAERKPGCGDDMQRKLMFHSLILID
jgi:hypothetical protein